MKKIIDGLSRSKLESLYNEWSSTGENPDLLKYVCERLQYIDKVNHDFVSHSSDRVVEHTEEDEARWNEFMKAFTVSDFSFLADSTYRSGNRIGVFMLDGELFFPYGMTLEMLTEFYRDPKHVYDYESTYNTLHYIRDRFYKVGQDSLFKDYEAKKKICELRLGDISKYCLGIKNGTKLKLSIGDTGLVRSANGTYSHIHPYQQTFIEAVAFGTDLEKLEAGNYEDCKRLLYLPKSVKK